MTTRKVDAVGKLITEVVEVGEACDKIRVSLCAGSRKCYVDLAVTKCRGSEPTVVMIQPAAASKDQHTHSYIGDVRVDDKREATAYRRTSVAAVSRGIYIIADKVEQRTVACAAFCDKGVER